MITKVIQDQATILDTPIQIEGFVIATIKQGLKARKIGMFITRGATTKFLLTKLSRYTGKKYKANAIEEGITDCDNLLNIIHENL
jgi:hypothetical protein